MRIKLLTSIVLLCIGTITNADDTTEQKPIPANTTNITQEQVTQEAAAQVINCDYKISSSEEVKNNLVIQWSEKAAMQSFTYNSTDIDNKLQALKNCFTDQGYNSYTEALTKSGNVEAIKTQQLNVSSLVDGKTKINKLENNKWQLKVPLQVVYQNNKEKLTQLLFVDMLVTLKKSGMLGISQIIAAPRDKIIEKQAEKVAT